MRQYHKVSSGTRSQVSSETFSKVACIIAYIASSSTSSEVIKTSHATHTARVNVSQETRRANVPTHRCNDGEDQFHHLSPLQTPQFQVARDSQQPSRLNRNADRRRRRARWQQIENSIDAIYSADTKCKVQTRVSLKQCEVRISIPEHETRVPQTHVSASKREVRVLPPKRETRVLPAPKCETRILPVPEGDSHISNTKREVCVLRQTQPAVEVCISTPCENHISTKKCEVRVQTGMLLRHTELKSLHPYGFEADSSYPHATDLRDYLTWKRSVH